MGCFASVPALHTAVLARDAERVEKLLKRRWTIVNQRDFQGVTALHYAARSESVRIVKRIAVAGGDVSAIDDTGNTPLHWAASTDKAEVVSYLCRHDAPVDIVNDAGQSALHIAARYGSSHSAIALLHGGADPYMPDDKGHLPLHLAAASNHLGFVHKMLAVGVIPDLLMRDGRTPLHLSAALGYLAVVDALLIAGASVNCQEHTGDTPLHWACACGHIDIVLSLLKHGADPDIVNANMVKPEELAVGEDIIGIIEAWTAGHLIEAQDGEIDPHHIVQRQESSETSKIESLLSPRDTKKIATPRKKDGESPRVAPKRRRSIGRLETHEHLGPVDLAEKALLRWKGGDMPDSSVESPTRAANELVKSPLSRENSSTAKSRAKLPQSFSFRLDKEVAAKKILGRSRSKSGLERVMSWRSAKVSPSSDSPTSPSPLVQKTPKQEEATNAISPSIDGGRKIKQFLPFKGGTAVT